MAATVRRFLENRFGPPCNFLRGGMLRFLRLRNRQGYDVFIQPFDGDRNAGYILVDLDRAEDKIIDMMRANGHEPCVVLGLQGRFIEIRPNERQQRNV